MWIIWWDPCGKRGVEKWLTPYLTNYSSHGPRVLLGWEIAIHHMLSLKRRMGVSGTHLSINFCTHNHHQKQGGKKVKLLHKIGWNCHVTSGRHAHTHSLPPQRVRIFCRHEMTLTNIQYQVNKVRQTAIHQRQNIGCNLPLKV